MDRIDLHGRRILVVEDEYVLCADIMDEIESHNGVVVGPAMTLAQGISMLHTEKPAACICNIRLGPNFVYELADELIERRVPFIFASGEKRADIPDRFAEVPLHAKPIEMIKTAAWLMGAGVPVAGE